MEVAHNDLWVMLLGTVRYSMGRSTYMTAYSVELVERYNRALTNGQLAQLAQEIEKELKTAEDAGRTLGMEMDHTGWREGVNLLKYILEKRESNNEEGPFDPVEEKRENEVVRTLKEVFGTEEDDGS